MMPSFPNALSHANYKAPGTRYVATYADLRLRDEMVRTITFRTEDGAIDAAIGLLDDAVGRRSYRLISVAPESAS